MSRFVRIEVDVETLVDGSTPTLPTRRPCGGTGTIRSSAS